MFVVFGSTDRERVRGCVVDRCPACLDLRWFELVDHHRAWHLYMVPLGRGRFLYTSRRCRECNADLPLEQADYVTTLTARDARELELEEGMRRTNPVLARRFDEIRALEREGPVYRDGNDDAGRALLAESTERLRKLERRGLDCSRFLSRFSGWALLSAHERELLAAELRGYLEAVER